MFVPRFLLQSGGSVRYLVKADKSIIYICFFMPKYYFVIIVDVNDFDNKDDGYIDR